ncbi:MAG: hypothetical protein KKE20_05820 [Nanoarchaeota archaeon]|nr:hypothetical protein [Nanoarchaeota archaeon]
MTELFKEFQEFRKILCVCPCCGDLVRVSDLHLKVKGPAAKTWLDEYDKKSQAMDKKEERFDELEVKLREKAREKGRKEAQKVFNKAISPAFKALKYDPFDVKPILNPVDFVVFKGMDKKESVSDIVMLSKICKNSILNTIRKQVKDAITNKKYEWQVARIDEKGKIRVE